MEACLHPRYAPAGSIRVWLGVTDLLAAPTLSWTLDGNSATPTTVLALQPSRPADPAVPDDRPIFTGVFDFPSVGGVNPHSVSVQVIGPTASTSTSAAINVKTLPAALPSGLGEWTSILLVSCYHYDTSPRGIFDKLMPIIQKECRPALTLFMGDQVYLDLPTIKDFPSQQRALEKQFEADYRRNWFESGGFSEVLAAAPSLSIADDHEYWNNFPHRSPFIQNSWTPAGRAAWTGASNAMLDAFQTPWPTDKGDEVIIDLPPVSMFVVDSRTDRQDDRSRAFKGGILAKLAAWIDLLNQQGKTGIFVTGQSIFDAAAKESDQDNLDRTLANHRDFPALVKELSRAENPLVCITGDVHWGRVLQVRDSQRANSLVYEIITSPASLVETIGVDQLRNAGNWVRSIFGTRNPWPRHNPTPDGDAQWPGGGKREVATYHRQLGDQVAVLSLRTDANNTVVARIRYYGLHTDPALIGPWESDPFELKHGIRDPF